MRNVTSPVTRPFVLRALVALFVASIFFDKLVFSGVGGAQNASNVLGLLLVGAYGLWLIARGEFKLRRPSGVFLIFILATGMLEAGRVMFGEGLKAGEVGTYLQYVQVFVLYIVILDVARDRRVLITTAAIFLLATFVMAAMALAGAGSLRGRTGRYGVEGLNLNRQAFFYSQCFTGVFCWILVRWPRFGLTEVVMSSMAVACLAALVKTGSRGGSAALLFGIALAMLLLYRRRNLPAYLTIVPIIVLFCSFIMAGSEVLQARINRAVQGNTGLRVELFMAATEMVRERPITGWGAAYMEELNDRIDRTTRNAIVTHNTYTQLLVSFGLIGSIPFFLGVYVTMRAAWKTRLYHWSAMFFILVASSLFTGMGMGLGYVKYFWVLLALTGAAASHFTTVGTTGSSGPPKPLAARRVPPVVMEPARE